MMKTLIVNTLEGFRLGEAMSHRNLCVFPLFNGEDTAPPYMGLKQALEKKAVEITETSESGSVPNLKVINQADEPVLLIDGEELAGAKQNRIVNTSLLIAAKSETLIPVSCTEQGRWNYTSRSFEESGEMMSSSSRYNKSVRLMHSLRAQNRYDAGQSEVWGDVQKLHSSLGTHSRTSAMKDAYLQKSGDITDYLDAFPLAERQKGLVVFVNGKLIGMDLVSRHDVYKDLHGKLLKSHIVEALNKETSLFDTQNLKVEAQLFLNSFSQLPGTDEFKPVGLGTDLRFDTDVTGGSALVFEGAIVHLNAFHKPGIGTEAPFGRFGRSFRERQAAAEASVAG